MQVTFPSAFSGQHLIVAESELVIECTLRRFLQYIRGHQSRSKITTTMNKTVSERYKITRYPCLIYLPKDLAMTSSIAATFSSTGLSKIVTNSYR